MTPEEVEARFQRIEANLEQASQVTISNARAIEANSNNIAETRAAMREETESMTQMILDLGDYVRGQAEQAERDRTEFRETVQRILDALQTQFSGNGH